MRRNLHSYVHGTQRGYAVGLCDGTQRFDEAYFHESDHNSLDACYRQASLRASVIEQTAKRRPRLIDWTPIPVACCN